MNYTNSVSAFSWQAQSGLDTAALGKRFVSNMKDSIAYFGLKAGRENVKRAQAIAAAGTHCLWLVT
jgi:hypothetical protein